ncbi:MAG: hypothetical protein RIM23_17640 [Coleofasciculus sp. G3-WIS-01]|uniref:hypothetical protein n=1 Tax=Coleofasciculus sp. G3-WIS-01 TaxID=3069528 RepID=UPI0032F822C6
MLLLTVLSFMKSSELLKNLSTPAQIVLRPMLLISLVLHGIVLMLPISDDLKKSENPEKEETVKITKLPSPSIPKSSPSPKSTSKVTPQRSPVTLSQTPQRRQTNSQIIINRPESPANPSSNQPINQPSVSSKVSQTEKQQTSETSNVVQTDQNKTSDRLDESDQNSTPPQPAQKEVNFFAIFPRYPGAEKGSGGVLRPEFDEANYIWHIEEDLETVASKFEKELLPNQNFQQPKLIKNEGNFRVYEVSNTKGNETKYLHFIHKDSKTSIYLESESYDLKELVQNKTEDRAEFLVMASLSSAIEILKEQYKLKDFNVEDDLDTLVEADKFKRANFDFTIARKTTADHPISPQELANTLNEQLQSLEFEPLSPTGDGEYGGGTLYKIKKDRFERYLILTPAKDEKENLITVIILARDDPRQ